MRARHLQSRLIRLGLAVKVEIADGEPAPSAEEIVDLNTLNVKDLREIGKQYGLTYKVGMTKEEFVAAIVKAQAEAVEVEDGEPAPVFDASEAVQ